MMHSAKMLLITLRLLITAVLCTVLLSIMEFVNSCMENALYNNILWLTCCRVSSIVMSTFTSKQSEWQVALLWGTASLA